MQKVLNKKYLKLITSIFVLAVLCVGMSAKAATGDVLFSCTFDGAGTLASEVVANCGGAGATMDTVASIVTGGHDGNKAVSYYYDNNPNDGHEIVRGFSTPTLNKQQITVDYWEKFDVPESVSGIWNVKSIRPYVGSGGNDYMAAIISRHNNGRWYQSTWGTATLTTESGMVSNVDDDNCSGTSSPYTCTARLSFNYVPSWNTNWKHIRVYIKPPSSDSSADGEVILWLDGEKIYTLSNINKSSLWSTGWQPYTTWVLFHPSDAFFEDTVGEDDWIGQRVAFHHSYDDITIYEGYIPPGGADTVAPANPSGLSVN